MLYNTGISSFDFNTLFWKHMVVMSDWTKSWFVKMIWERGLPCLPRVWSMCFLIGGQDPADEGHLAFSLFMTYILKVASPQPLLSFQTPTLEDFLGAVLEGMLLMS